jgi:signal transduction histidine kinase
MIRFKSTESAMIPAAAIMALASLCTSVLLSHGLQRRILHVQESTALRRQLSLLTITLREAEAAQRNLVITGDAAHDAAFQAAQATLEERWNSITTAAAHDPLMQDLAAELHEGATSAMNALTETITLRISAGREPALASVETGESQALLAATHARLAMAMEQIEERLGRESRELMRAERLGHTGALVTGSIALLLAGLGVWQGHRAIRHRERELSLSLEKSRAEQSARDKGEFLAVVSHELRTPLHAMLGLSETLRDELPPGPGKDQASAVHSAATTMLRLVTDLLDLSRMEANRMELTSEPIDPLTFAADLKHLLAAEARRAGLDLKVAADPSLPRSILCDEVRLRQIATNVAGNAIKFTPPGGKVSLLLSRQADSQGDSLLLEVSDTGCGIPESLQRAIFEPYKQLRNRTHSSGPDGFGLGLAIVRSLVNLMSGSISVQSSPCQGTIFRVSLPLVLPSEPLPPSQSAALPPTSAAPLPPDAAGQLGTILSTLLPAARATYSTADVLALADALASLGTQEQCPLITECSADLRRASASFSITALGKALGQLPDRLAPLLPS